MTNQEQKVREKATDFLCVVTSEPRTESGLGKLAIDAIFARRSGADIARALLAVLDVIPRTGMTGTNTEDMWMKRMRNTEIDAAHAALFGNKE